MWILNITSLTWSRVGNITCESYIQTCTDAFVSGAAFPTFSAAVSSLSTLASTKMRPSDVATFIINVQHTLYAVNASITTDNMLASASNNADADKCHQMCSSYTSSSLNSPGRQEGHGLVVFEHKMYVFGGYSALADGNQMVIMHHVVQLHRHRIPHFDCISIIIMIPLWYWLMRHSHIYTHTNIHAHTHTHIYI